jgi:uncharacterized protein YfbU (UPF0304 family)
MVKSALGSDLSWDTVGWIWLYKNAGFVIVDIAEHRFKDMIDDSPEEIIETDELFHFDKEKTETKKFVETSMRNRVSYFVLVLVADGGTNLTKYLLFCRFIKTICSDGRISTAQWKLSNTSQALWEIFLASLQRSETCRSQMDLSYDREGQEKSQTSVVFWGLRWFG